MTAGVVAAARMVRVVSFILYGFQLWASISGGSLEGD